MTMLPEAGVHRGTTSAVAAVRRTHATDKLTEAKLDEILAVTPDDVAEAKTLLADLRAVLEAVQSQAQAIDQQLEAEAPQEKTLGAKKKEAATLRRAGVAVPDSLTAQITDLKIQIAARKASLHDQSRSLRGQERALVGLDKAFTREVRFLPLSATAKRALELKIIKNREFRQLTDGKLSWINEKMVTQLVKHLWRQSSALGDSEHITNEEKAEAREKVLVLSSLLHHVKRLRNDSEYSGHGPRDALAVLTQPGRLVTAASTMSIDSAHALHRSMNMAGLSTVALLSADLVEDFEVDLLGGMGGPLPFDTPMDAILTTYLVLSTVSVTALVRKKLAAKADPTTATMLEAGGRTVAWEKLQ